MKEFQHEIRMVYGLDCHETALTYDRATFREQMIALCLCCKIKMLKVKVIYHWIKKHAGAELGQTQLG